MKLVKREARLWYTRRSMQTQHKIVTFVAICALVIGVAAQQVPWASTDKQDVLSVAEGTDGYIARDLAQTDTVATKQFSPNEFSSTYNTLPLPNVTPILFAPAITGNPAIDKVIRDQAEQRGYRLQYIASSDLHERRDGAYVQSHMVASLDALLKAALDEGIDLQIVSGYRSIAGQRALFMDKIRSLGVPVEQLIQERFIAQLDKVLSVASPPGYSRHHSGYTVDISDSSYPIFSQSKGFEWISRDNYANAKEHGFIPSYPVGVDNQGPNPESWEYVWVGASTVIEKSNAQ